MLLHSYSIFCTSDIRLIPSMVGCVTIDNYILTREEKNVAYIKVHKKEEKGHQSPSPTLKSKAEQYREIYGGKYRFSSTVS